MHSQLRDVAQPGLEYTSGGRGVASSNLVIPTERKSKGSWRIKEIKRIGVEIHWFAFLCVFEIGFVIAK